MTPLTSTPLEGRTGGLPAPAPPPLTCDAVGLSDHDARRVMDLLPRVGCVFADAGRWWWLVPSQSDIGITWPPTVRYEVGASMPASAVPPGRITGARPGGPRLIHAPDGAVPYTHPLLLYVAVCAVAGIDPSATEPAGSGPIAGEGPEDAARDGA